MFVLSSIFVYVYMYVNVLVSILLVAYKGITAARCSWFVIHNGDFIAV